MNKYLKNYPFNIPKIGLGLAALGRPGYINLHHGRDLQHDYSVESMYQNTKAVLEYAWKAGIRYFDAARSYGKAEEFLSNWLKEQNINKDEIIVASKWGMNIPLIGKCRPKNTRSKNILSVCYKNNGLKVISF